ncbi:MAG: hypothetical protein ACFBSC_02910 [Microcoleaceae cyanobacterium]
MTAERQERYFSLIEELMKCPNGKEPEVLDAQPELLDADFVKTVMQVATAYAHQGNQDASKFLVHIARELARQLDAFPQVSPEV